jgi:hypothetical protein
MMHTGHEMLQLVIVEIVNQNRIRAIEHEDHAPISIHGDCPVIFQLALQRDAVPMTAPTNLRGARPGQGLQAGVAIS